MQYVFLSMDLRFCLEGIPNLEFTIVIESFESYTLSFFEQLKYSFEITKRFLVLMASVMSLSSRQNFWYMWRVYRLLKIEFIFFTTLYCD